MSIKIGDLDVIHSQVLLIPEGDDAWVEFKVLNWEVKLHFVFIEDNKNANESSYKLVGKDDHALFELKNWKNPLGMSFSEPIEFGTTEGRSVYIMLLGYTVGNLRKLDLQILLGGLI